MMLEELKRLKVIRYKCENDLMFFTRYIFKENTNRKFKQYEHLRIISETLQKVARGEIKRLVINIPPRYGKTEISVKMFIAWGLALNPKSKFIHLSYSDDLALDNSQLTKEYVESEAFKNIWGLELKKDSKSKKKWYTQQGGGVYATASGGAVTGFGAGNKEDDEIDDFIKTINDLNEFNGAIIVDDPIKPDDARSDTKRNAINERYNNTIRSRVNSRNTPIIYIMQRVHEDDPSGFLLDGGSGEKWHHLKLSAIKKDGSALCPDIHTIGELREMEKADPYMFAGQYQQEPAPLDGGKIKREWFEIVDISDVPDNLVKDMYIDGAFTDRTENDPTGLDICGYNKQTDTLYVFNALDEYMELPELLDLIPKHAEQFDLNRRSTIRIEPKASGQALRPMLRKLTVLNATEIKGKQVSEGKTGRVEACSPTMRAGKVKLVKGAWNNQYLTQLAIFPNGKHDEHVDNLCYAICDNFDIYRKKRRVSY